MERIDIADNERDQARADMEAALAVSPDDPELTYQLAVWRLVEAQTQRRFGRDPRAQQLQDEALKMVRDYHAAHADSVQAQLNLLRILSVAGRRPQVDPALLAEARDLLADLERKLADGKNIRDALELASHLIRLDNERVELEDGTATLSGVVRAEQMLRSVVQANPDSVQAIMGLANLLKQQGRVDDAIEFFRVAKEDRPIPVSIDAMRMSEYQVVSVRELADLYLAKYERETDPEKRAEWLDNSRDEAAELAARAPGSGWVDLIEGKLALVDGDLAKAVKKLDSANNQLEGRSIDALRLGAQALLQMGQTGAAAQRLEQLITTPAGSRFVKPYIDLARLRVRQNSLDRAMTYIETVLNNNPDNTEALLLKSEILARQARIAQENGDASAADLARQAGLALTAVPDQTGRAVAQQKARLAQMAGDNEQARDILAAWYQQNPDDFVTLQQLVRLEKGLGNDDAAMKLIEEAMARNPERKEVLEVIAQSLRGETEAVTEQLEEVLQKEEDPVVRELRLYAFYKQTDRPELAAKHLGAVIKSHPDDERVMSVQFELALQEKDWDKATALSERAGQMKGGAGLDQAQGRFWIGRRQLAQGQHRQAVLTLEQAVRDMPVNSEGWLLLGDARRATQNLAGAETAYKQSIELKPENPQAWRRLFLIHDARGQVDEAMADMQQMLQYSRGDAAVYASYLDYLGRHGDPQEVLARRQKLAQRRPDDQANLRAMVQLHMRLGQSEQAKALVDKLLEIDGTSRANIFTQAVYLARQGDLDQGEKVLRDYVHSRGDQTNTEDWLTFARYLRQANRRDAAVAAYHKAIETEDAEAMPASRELGDWVFADREYAESVPLYKAILEASENKDLGVWRRYVEALLQSGEVEAADAELKKLIAEHKADGQVHLLQGLIAEKKENIEAAEAAYDAAVWAEQANPTVYIQRARYRMASGKPALIAQAKTDLERAVQLDQNGVTPREMLVRWHLQNKDTAAAIDELQRLIAVRPSYTVARVQLAQMFVSQGSAGAGELERLINDSEKRMPNMPMWDQLRAQLALMQLPPGADPKQRAMAHRGAALSLAKAYAKEKTLRNALLLVEAHLSGVQADDALAVLNEWPDELNRSPQLQAMRARALAVKGEQTRPQARAGFAKALAMAGGNAEITRTVIGQLQSALPVEDQLPLLEANVENDASGLSELIICQLWLTQKNYDQALGRLARMHDRKPKDVTVLRALSAGYYMAKQPAKSAEFAQKLLVEAPDDLMALNNLAYMLADDLDRPAEAIEMAQRAVDLVGREDGQRANVLDTLGWVQFRAGRIDEAVSTLRTSVNLQPMAANCLHLGTVLAHRGQPELARTELMRAKQMAEETKDEDILQKVDAQLAALQAAASAAEE
jgi:tetratricopeptide (TPR) repeat protein